MIDQNADQDRAAPEDPASAFFVLVLTALELNPEFRTAMAREITAVYMGCGSAEQAELLQGAMLLVDHHVAGRGLTVDYREP